MYRIEIYKGTDNDMELPAVDLNDAMNLVERAFLCDADIITITKGVDIDGKSK